jgi:hypothetical protein
MNSTAKFKPSRIVAVINDALVPGIQFQQPTKSGAVWVLLWSPETDRLFKWDCPAQKWNRIKPDIISAAKKRSLIGVAS